MRTHQHTAPEYVDSLPADGLRSLAWGSVRMRYSNHKHDFATVGTTAISVFIRTPLSCNVQFGDPARKCMYIGRLHLQCVLAVHVTSPTPLATSRVTVSTSERRLSPGPYLTRVHTMLAPRLRWSMQKLQGDVGRCLESLNQVWTLSFDWNIKKWTRKISALMPLTARRSAISTQQ